jgi:hypothetical protein
MYRLTDEELRQFMTAEFATDGGSNELISERQFIEVLCVHFFLEEETRLQLKDSHEYLIRQLVRLYPTIGRDALPAKRGSTRILRGIRALDLRWIPGGEERARWSELEAFVQSHCRIEAGSFAQVSLLRDAYNAAKKNPVKVRSIGLAKKLLETYPSLARSVHRVSGLNCRCLDGIRLVVKSEEVLS